MSKRNTAFIGFTAALLLSGCANARSGGANSIGHSVQSDVIGITEAEKAALEHAGFAAEEVTVTKTEYDLDDNEYDVEFTAGDYKYEYDIGAADGGIIKFSKEKIAASAPDGASAATDNSLTSPPETDKPPAEPDKTSGVQPATTPAATTTPAAPSASAGRITPDEAKAAALAHAGLSASDVVFTKTEFELDDGRGEYDVEFVTSDHEYEYEIAAENGAVLSYSKEALDVRTAAPARGDIGAEEAKAAALAHAGLSASDVVFTKTEFELDDGRGEYEIEFTAGGTEYEYKLDAATGDIIEFEAE